MNVASIIMHVLFYTDSIIILSQPIAMCSARTLRMIVSTSELERVEVVKAKCLRSANSRALRRHSYMGPRGLKTHCVRSLRLIPHHPRSGPSIFAMFSHKNGISFLTT